jgi:urocanate hydratase
MPMPLTGIHLRACIFFDYGNALSPGGNRGQAPDVTDAGGKFRYPSYVQGFNGVRLCFDFGFGPFRWVCCFVATRPTLDVTDKNCRQLTLKEILRGSTHRRSGSRLKTIFAGLKMPGPITLL